MGHSYGHKFEIEINNRILRICIHSTLLHLPALAIVKMETQKRSVLVVLSPIIISSTFTESLMGTDKEKFYFDSGFRISY